MHGIYMLELLLYWAAGSYGNMGAEKELLLSCCRHYHQTRPLHSHLAHSIASFSHHPYPGQWDRCHARPPR